MTDLVSKLRSFFVTNNSLIASWSNATLQLRGKAQRSSQRSALVEHLEARRMLTPVPTEGPDVLVYDDNPNIGVDGLGGDDNISLMGGDDVGTGGAGNDTINGNTGRDQVFGGTGDDIVRGGADDDYIVLGEDGNDYVYGDKGNDGDFNQPGTYFVNGGKGNDHVFGGDGNDVVRGGQGDDWVYGDDDPNGPQSNPVATGNDWIAGDLGNDQLFGQGGADTFYFQPDAAGTVDTINDWTPSQGDRIDLSAFDAQPGNPFATGVITDFGSLTMTQVGGNTEILLPTSQKIVLLNTTVSSVLPQYFFGKASIDHRGNDTLQAGSSGEQLNGREGDDVVTGGASADFLNGNMGRDQVDGGPGNDIVRGGKDDDYYVRGGDGDDHVYGDLGNDAEVNGNKGRDYVDGGPGNDVVRGGADDDYQVLGGDGNDLVYGDDGNDAEVNGNAGDDQVYGGNGNDVVRGGKGNDYVSGDAGDDMVYGDLGTNILSGGTGKDTFVITNGFNVQNTITDFQRGSDRIDLTAFGDLTTYEQVSMRQEGSNVVLQLTPTNKLIIQGQTLAQIKSTDFIGPWSANKSISLWVPGLLHDRITQAFASQGGANATTPTGNPVIDVAEYRINGFDPQANPGNLLPYRPFQLIDLRSLSVTQVNWRQDGNDTIVVLDARFGKVLRLVGVQASQVSRQNFLTVGQDQQSVIDNYLSDWTDQSQVERSVVPPGDRFFTEGNRIIYQSTPTVISMVNKLIPQGSSSSLVVRPDPNGPEIQVIENFDPANPLDKIDLSGLGIRQIEQLGFEQLGDDTKINFSGGFSLIFKQTLVSDFKEVNFIGWDKPQTYSIFYPLPLQGSSAPLLQVEGFDATRPDNLIDLTGISKNLSSDGITLETVGSDTWITFRDSTDVVVVKNVIASALDPKALLLTDADIHALGTSGAASQIQAPDSSGGGNSFVSAGYSSSTGVLKVTVNPYHDPASDPANAENLINWAIGQTTSIATNVVNNTPTTLLMQGKVDQDQFYNSMRQNFGDPIWRNKIADLEKAVEKVDTARGNINSAVEYAVNFKQEFDRIKSERLQAGDSESVAREIAITGAFMHATAIQLLTALAERGADTAYNYLTWGLVEDPPAMFAIKMAKPFVLNTIDTYIEDFIKDAYIALPRAFVDEINLRIHGEIGSLDISGGESLDAFQSEDLLNDELLADLPTLAEGQIQRGEDGLLYRKEVVDGVPGFRKVPDAPSAVQGDPIDTSQLPPPSGTDLDSENGAFYTYAEGVYYKWDGAHWNQIPRGVDPTTDPEFDPARLTIADHQGSTSSGNPLQISIDIPSLVTGAIGEWYTKLTQDVVVNGVVTSVSGLKMTASQSAGTFLADLVLNGDFDQAIQRAKDAAIQSQINQVKSQVEDHLQATLTSAFGIHSDKTAAAYVGELFGNQQWVGNFAVDLAKTLGEQLIEGKFDDSFASQVVTQTAINFGIGQGLAIATGGLKGGITGALADGLGLADVVPLGFDPLTIAASIIIETLLNKAFSHQIAEVETFIGDVGEDVWDFVRDPVNSIKDLFDDPKFRSIDGTVGDDTLYQPSRARVQSDLKAGNDVMFGGDGWGVVLGGLGDDIITNGDPIPGGGVPGNGIGELYGEEGADYIDAGGGNDELYGGGGADILYGGAGNDVLSGGDASPARTYTRDTGPDEGDYLDGGLGNDTYTGGAGRDTFVITLEPGAVDTITDFHSGEDFIDLSQFHSINDFGDVQIAVENAQTVLVLPDNQRVILNHVPPTGLSRGDFIFTQYGTSGPDQLLGSDAVEVFNGLQGNDDLRLGGGNDVANGNQGDDQIAGGAGDDQLRGGQDNDTITGGEGNDDLRGDLGDDFLNGNQGNDRVDGGAGNDQVRGGRGDDLVLGGDGDDQLIGDLGNDVLLGGHGADDFVITPDPGSTDSIQDFSLGDGDRLVLSGFVSSPLTADNFAQVGYDVYVTFPSNQIEVVRFANLQDIETALGIGGNANFENVGTPDDQAPPVISGLTGTYQTNQNAVTVQPFSGADFDDADSPDLSGGQMVVSVSSGNAQLALDAALGSLNSSSPSSGPSNQIVLLGQRVLWNGFDVGGLQISADQRTLTLTFSANATSGVIQQVLNDVAATNFSSGAGISIQFSDGDGAQSLPFTQNLQPDATRNAIIGNPSVSDVAENVNVDANGLLKANGTISIADPDQGGAQFQTVVTSDAGNLGTLTLASNGAYTYSVLNSAIQFLGEGETRVESFLIKALDGTTKDVSFTIHGIDNGTVGLTGATLNISATSVADTITVTVGANLVIWMNGVKYSYAPGLITVVNIHGNSGSDSLTFNGSSDNESVTFHPGKLDVAGTGFAIHSDGFENVRANSGGGTNDRAYLYDSAGNDSLIATPSYAQLTGSGFTSYASGFDYVYAYATAGTSGGIGDKASFFDSAGNDTLTATPAYSQLSGPGYFNYAASFDQVYAYATAGGAGDRANLFDSAGNDTFIGTPTYSLLKGTGYYNYVQSFDQVSAYATAGDAGGAGDIASLYDSAGNDMLTETPLFSLLKGAGFYNYAQSFNQVFAYASAGNAGGPGDVASLYDSTGNDTLISKPAQTQLSGAGYSNNAFKFGRVTAYATAGDTGGVGDRAYLYDSTGNDVLTSTPVHSILSGSGYWNDAEHFDKVYAYASTDAGGTGDRAYLYDSAGNDILTATPLYAQLTGSGYFNYASRFDQVYAYASGDAGGTGDRANLFDSAGNDTLTATPTYAQLTGAGFLNYASRFDQVYAYASTDAGGTGDRANLFDSAGNDTLTATPTYSLLKGLGFYNYAQGFDKASAYATAGNAGGVGDVANLYDSAGSDKLFARSDYAWIQGTGFYNYVRGFQHVNGYAVAGGDDTLDVGSILYDFHRFGSWEHLL